MKIAPRYLTFSLGDLSLRCEYNYSPGTPDTMYRSSGDPGDEGDPEEFEVTKVELEVWAATTFAPAVWRDISDFLKDLDADDKLDELARAAFSILPEADLEPPSGYDDGRD